MASLTVVAARLLQCIFCAGSPPSASATALSVMTRASSMVLPFTISVTMLLVATAAPHPNVLNLMSTMWSSSTLMKIFMMSPQTGLPAVPTPSASGISPTLRGLEKWSITLSLYISSSLLLVSSRGPYRDGPDHLCPSSSGVCPSSAVWPLSSGLAGRLGVQRRHIAHPLDDAGQDGQHVVHLCLGVVVAERQAQGAVGDLYRHARRQEHVRRLQRCR